MWKHILVLALILTTIGGYVFWSSPRKREMQRDASENGPAQVATQQKNMAAPAPQKALPPSLSKGERVSQTLIDYYADVDLEDADPDVKKMLDIFASPEFAAFVDETEEYTTEGYYGFLESQGIPWDRDAYYRDIQEAFQKHFPGETPESVEPQIRQRFINAFVGEATNFTEMLTEFLDEKTLAWVSARFPQSYREFGEWVAWQIKEPFQSTSARDAPPPKPETPPSVYPADAVSTDAQRVEDIPRAEDVPTESSETPPSRRVVNLEVGDILTARDGGARDAALDAEIRKWLEQAPDDDRGFPFPTEASFEKRLRETFSPQRVNTAQQTLTRYGPEEGLRRLQESDPDIAPHFERLIQRQKETD